MTINFITFDLIILSGLNSNPNNLLEILFIRVFVVNCLMCLNISFIALKLSKSSLSRSIQINSQSSPCIAFWFVILLSIYQSLCPFSSIFIASL